MEWRPGGLMKRTSSICPTSCASTSPGSLIVTCPVWLTLKSMAYDGGLDQIAVVRDDLPVRVDLPVAVARVGDRAVRHHDLKEALARDGDVRVVVRGLKRALREDARRTGNPDAEADLNAGRDHRIGVDRNARFPVDLIEQIRCASFCNRPC